jgi:hypothetical protein
VRAGIRVSITAASTATNENALTPNTSAALVAASSSPPIAGPTARARFWLTDPSAIACGRSDAGTSSGWSVCQVGAPAAPPTPITNSSAISSQGVNAPIADSSASPAAASSITSCATRIRRLRSTRSPSAPDGTASNRTGMLPAAEIALSNSAELVSVVITHWAATVCIHEPMLLVNCASHRRR